MRVLVIDDDYAVLDAVRETLEDEGYEVSIAANGEEALGHLRERGRPCLILLDLMMPVMNGWEFRRRQLADELLASIPTVIVTAYVGPIPNDFGEAPKVRKPVKPEQLISLVARYCPKPGSAPDTIA